MANSSERLANTVELFAAEQFKTVEALLFSDEVVGFGLTMLTLYCIWFIYVEIRDAPEEEDY